MPDKKYAEFLAAVDSAFEELDNKLASDEFIGTVKDFVCFNCSNPYWATYSFTDNCPPQPELRNSIISTIRDTVARFPDLTLAYYPDKLSDSRNS